MATFTGTVWFRQAIMTETSRRTTAEQALAVTERLLSDEERQQSQQRHDATSAIYGIHLAWSALDGHGDGLPEETRSRLRTASLQELTRLQELIGRPRANSLQRVRLAEVLHPVVAAGREAGHEVDLDVGQTVVLAHAADLQAVVQTLLAGHPFARTRHVSFSAEGRDGYVDLAIHVDAGRRRSTASAPTALIAAGAEIVLGYYTCERLMREMQGKLSDAGPGTFVLSLRAADLPESAEHTVEIAHAADARTPAVPAAPATALGIGHRLHDDHETCSDTTRQAAFVNDGKIDADALLAVTLANVEAAGPQDARQRIGQQDRPRHDDGRELSASCHESSDAPAAAGCIPPKMENQVERL